MHLRSIYILSIVFLVTLVPLSSCKKYEDGPLISFSSKTSRVANTWKVEKVTEGGSDKTSDYSDMRVTFTKGGDYTVQSGKGTFNLATNGKWSFINNNDDLQLISNPVLGVSSTTTYHILKLEQNHLWVTEGDTEYHFISA